MKTRSAKDKGRRLQNIVKETFREAYPEVSEDIHSAVMGESGVDIKLSEAAKLQIPFDIECKWVERLNLREAYDQSRKNLQGEKRIPIVIHKKNRQDILVTLSFEDFMRIIK